MTTTSVARYLKGPVTSLIRGSRANKRDLVVSLAAVALGMTATFTLSEFLLAGDVASASTIATATISAGTLSVSVPAAISFSDTLNGLDQTTTAGSAIDVRDATGSGAGWNLTATSTQFTAGSNTLATLGNGCQRSE